MRSTGLLVLCLVWAMASAPAAQQTTAPAQQPVFRGGVDLVTLDVRVVDKDGKPLAGLTPSDFLVTLDGQSRPVRALDYLTFGPSTDAATSVTQASGSPAPKPASRGGRVIVFMFDDLSARPLQAKELTTAALRLLPTLDGGDLVGLATTSGRGPVISPTRDRAAVVAALNSKQLVGLADQRPSPFVTVNEAIGIVRGLDKDLWDTVLARECGTTAPGKAGASNKCPSMVKAVSNELNMIAAQNTRDQINAFAQVIAALHAAPAPRVLVALTCGLAMSPFEPSPLATVSRAAADADVAFYALVTSDEVGVDLSDGGDAGRLRAAARREESVFLVGNTQAMAEAAGGEALRAIGQPDRFLHQIVTEASAMYRLGVEAPAGTDPNRYLAVKVSVKQPGYSVHTNVHAIRTPAITAATPSPGEALRARLAQGGAAYGVPIHFGARLRREPAGVHVQVIAAVEVPAATPGPLTTMFALVNGAGSIIESGRMDVPVPAAGDYRVAVPLAVDEGDYHVRVVVADVNGNIGSVDEPVAAHLHHLGPLTTSDLLMTATAEDGGSHLFTSEEVPAHTATIATALELYADALPADVTVHLALTAAGGGPVVTEADFTPATVEGHLAVSSDLPMSIVPAGQYVLTATVLQAGHPVGTLSVNLHKVE